MRTIRFAALLIPCAAFTFACGGEEPAPQAPPPPAAQPAPVVAVVSAPPVAVPPLPPAKPSLAELIPQTLKGVDDAFNSHDAKKLAGFYAEDCTIIGNGEHDAHGRDEVARALQMMFDVFGDAKSAATRVWMKGNVAVTELAWAGTMTGDFMGNKATKKPAGQLRLHVLFFNDDGLIKEVHQYADSAGMMAQLEAKPGAPAVPVLPTNPPDVHMSKGTPDEDKLADWGKGIDETLSKDDPKAALSGVADDGDDWVNMARGASVKGKKEVAKALDMWFKAIPDQKWNATNAWGIDGFAIVESTVSGTQKGRLGALPPTNKPVTGWHWIDIWQPAADGKVAHHWAYANPVELMQQTGAFKPHAEKPAGASTTGKEPNQKPMAVTAAPSSAAASSGSATTPPAAKP